MKKFSILIMLGTIAVSMVQCTPKKATTTEKSPSEKVADIKKNYTEAQMAEGKTLFEADCAKCHRLHQPEEHDIAKWENVLPRMTKRAKMDDAQAGMVRAYILTHAKMN